MIKAVLFDADGVIVKAHPFTFELESQFKIPRAKTQSFFAERFLYCLIGQADLKEEVKKYLDSWNWKETVEELLLFWFNSENIVDQRIVNTIQELKESGLKVCLASNQEKYRSDFLLNKMGFKDLFDYTYFSWSIGYIKSNPLFLKKLLISYLISNLKRFYFSMMMRGIFLQPKKLVSNRKCIQILEVSREESQNIKFILSKLPRE